MENVIALGLLGITTWTDYKSFTIYNKHIVIAFVLGVAYHTYTNGIFGFKAALFGAFIGLSILLPAWFLGALGGGDVKVFAALGAIMGFPFLVKMTFWLAVYIVLFSIPLLIYKKRLLTGLKWTLEYLLYFFVKVATLGIKEKEPPIIEDGGTPIKAAFIISAAAITTIIMQGVGLQ